ncbi:OmpA family protein [Maribacter cobaltidurans]|uniref:Cell envelope biogenesis protein OmpA n=1 Tax=Maribacter cobaltidurans TaxID=1178778 RepID=A0A223VAZ4_9FLAO|nr:OmpA family protein [Maribacter cobaltidurans]ASV32545.1 cell envelope biogenesis protein OmpA [Maribacter cobaltidurans]GGD68858.1 cell envelope biogenesis protein OmpA [Maribacter cobaltidurans]
MKVKEYIFLLLIFLPGLMVSQGKNSKGDNYFYGYQYGKAIAEYQKERQKGPLSNSQLLNLADSYFKVGNYKNASELYQEVNKNDTIMTVHQFNQLLQSLSKTSSKDRVQTFLRSKSPLLSNELMDNAEFNFEILGKGALDANKVTLVNLSLNTAQTDFSPAFYKNKLLFSSSRPLKSKGLYEPSGESYLDIYEVSISDNGKTGTVNLFDMIPDSKFHKSTPYYSEENNRIFYILSNSEEGEMTYDENGKNSLALGMLYNSGQFRFLLKNLSTSFYYPFYDDSTDRLYFAANFDDSYGGTDLYYVATNNGQVMSAPVNLGPRINSPGNEIAPYIFDGSLYFSSDVFYGLGGMDVYKSRIQGRDIYGVPVNLGEGINSKEDDFGFIIRKGNDGYTGYLASNRPGGKGGDDIYSFRMESIPGLKTFALRGNVVDASTNLSIPKAQIRILDKQGNLLKELYSDENGDFSFEIPWQEEIVLQSGKGEFSAFSRTYSGSELDEIQKNPYTIDLLQLEDLVEETEGKRVVKLRKFYFPKGKSNLTSEITMELDKVVEAVQNFPDVRLRIETHTDSRGSSASNQKLSQQRSDVIRDYLVSKGVPAETILESVGYGEENIKNNCTNGVYCLDFLHKQNERTLIEVVNN